MIENDIVIQLATIEDAENIHAVMQKVHDGMENKSLYVCDDIEYVKNHIDKDGFALKACDADGKIAGCFIARFPDLALDNLGRDIGLPDNELCKVVHMESAVVLPEYRGRGIQGKLIQYAEKTVDSKKFKYLMSTVSPDNPASFKTMEKAGYVCVLTKEKYNGLMRRIYLKNISNQN